MHGWMGDCLAIVVFFGTAKVFLNLWLLARSLNPCCFRGSGELLLFIFFFILIEAAMVVGSALLGLAGIKSKK
jgi:hypothetical protein